MTGSNTTGDDSDGERYASDLGLSLGAATGERRPDPEPMAMRLGDVALR